ncbi:ubiquinone/menaquinone biosynthesis C-methylase UbiE [Anaerosolibacter carboniphilus]|uniref:Ubiquinone/menaquinone biosynthesis C-methylase UbiE n=1 Tax=Anaerosolibacter carboniphilus TaxID=1417629 RepID=A0A841L1B9_9FIRM|nr:class I SAM-dependent methyltransferase [Anaerosolibacter carboniphilus]MBB6216165.1 ubiquinone/menaquinone biosynthesis C-methylase UbiE [Anaerosolibacter carboniphilus]
MREEMALEKRTSNYDETIYGLDKEYEEVFESHDKILKYICEKVSDNVDSTIIEIAVGIGNLTKLLSQNGFRVIGIEPSEKMRMAASLRVPNIPILDGHFLSIPITSPVDAIVTSFGFHYLSYAEKKKAIDYFDSFLTVGGKIVIADVMYVSAKSKKDLLKHVKARGAAKLLNDLNTRYYEYVEDISELFREKNYTYEMKKMNKYVWVVCGRKED